MNKLLSLLFVLGKNLVANMRKYNTILSRRIDCEKYWLILGIVPADLALY